MYFDAVEDSLRLDYAVIVCLVFLVRSTVFYYVAGISVGVLMSALIIVVIVGRLFTKVIPLKKTNYCGKKFGLLELVLTKFKTRS